MASIADQVNIIITADSTQAKKAIEDLDVLLLDFKGSASGAGSGLNETLFASDQLGAVTKSTTSSLLSQITAFASLATAATALSRVMRQAISDAEDERIGLVRLQAVLEATGRSHEITAGQIDAMAQRLEDYAYLDKQAIMDATARLATYDNIASDLFDRILASAADLSAVFGTDISSAISDLGRVMEDPLDGLTRLRRQGVMVSQEVEDQVSSLVEQNRLYEAQSLILDEIDTKVGGIAEQIADVAGGQGLLTAWNKFIGELGNTVIEGTSGIQSALADLINGATSVLEYRNLLKQVSGIDLDSVLSMDTADLQDTYDKILQLMEMTDSGWGPQYDTMLHVTQRDLANSGIVEALEAELEARRQLAEAEEEAEEAEKRQEEARARRIDQLETESSLTRQIADLYASTAEGQVASIESQIDAVKRLREEDERYLASLMSATSIDMEVYSQVEERMGMYDAVLAQLEQDLADLTIVPEVDTSTITEQLLGMSAEDYVLSIPISLDLDGRSEAQTLEEQMSVLSGRIQALYKQRPVDESALADWQSSMDILVGKYQELSKSLDDVQEKTRQQEEAQSHYEALVSTASAELRKLMSDQELAMAELADYEETLGELLEARLISQDQYNALLERQRDLLIQGSGQISDWDRTISALSSEWERFTDAALSYDAVAQTLTSAFESMGAAWASGGDIGESAMDVFGDFAQQLTQEMSTMFISAGLRCIIEGGWAGLGIGLALIAAGGLTGFATGAMNGSAAALDDSILDAMQDELDARQKLADSINDSIDTEYDLLRRQLERNLISEEEFRDTASDLQGQRNVADARAELSASVLSKIEELNAEYAGMSGWDKFWSRRDEDIEDELSKLQSYYNSIMSVTEDELRSMVQTLKELGVSVGNVPAFASGGEFVTSGPQLIRVGDNASGREHVKITPLDAGESVSQPSTVIYLTGDVYGIEDLYGKLSQVGIRMERRMR